MSDVCRMPCTILHDKYGLCVKRVKEGPVQEYLYLVLSEVLPEVIFWTRGTTGVRP
jgi:hypothetical protein